MDFSILQVIAAVIMIFAPYLRHNILLRSAIADNRAPFTLQPADMFQMDSDGDNQRPQMDIIDFVNR